MEGTSEWAVARPAPVLRPFVAHYHGYRQTGLAPGVHRGLPSPFLTLILTLDEPVVLASHAGARRYDALAGGLHTSPVLITHDGAQSGVQVALHPPGARALLGLPAGELAALDVPADAVLGADADRLRQQLQACASWPERFAVLDRVLQARLDRLAAPQPPVQVLHAWRRLHATGGSVRVAQLADETGWSARHLGSVLRRETGLAPKEAARVVRFDRARRAVARAGGRDLAGVAAACGYADQSHLDREFRAFSGLPPSRWWAEEFRNVQAPPEPHGAASGHD